MRHPRTVFVALCFAVSLLATVVPPQVLAQPASPSAGSDLEANEALVLRYYELFNRGSFDAMPEIFAPDFALQIVPPGEDAGLSGLIAGIEEVRIGLPDLTIDVNDLFAEGNMVVARTTIRGTHLGDFFGVPPTGTVVQTEAIDLWQVVDGKLTANWHLEDILGIMQQVGMMPSGGAAATSVAPGLDATPAAAGAAANPATIEEQKALARRFYAEIFERGDVAVADEILTPDFVWHNQVPPGPAGVKTFATEMRTAFPDLRLTAEHVVAEGDRVAILWTLSGTHQGEFFGVPATGQRVMIPGLDIYRIDNGKIAELWTVGDDLSLLAQLGAIPGFGDDAATPAA